MSLARFRRPARKSRWRVRESERSCCAGVWYHSFTCQYPSLVSTCANFSPVSSHFMPMSHLTHVWISVLVWFTTK